MERRHAEEGVEGKCRKDKGHDLWYRPRPLAEFMLLPALTSRHLSYRTRGHVYSACVRSAMLHENETWPLTNMNQQCNDSVMIRQICSIKPEDVARVR